MNKKEKDKEDKIITAIITDAAAETDETITVTSKEDAIATVTSREDARNIKSIGNNFNSVTEL